MPAAFLHAADGMARGARRRRLRPTRSRRSPPSSTRERRAAYDRLARSLDDDRDFAARRAAGARADVRRALRRRRRRSPAPRWSTEPMALLQISEPGASPDPHQRRHRRRHRPRHDAFARRRGAQRRRRVPARRDGRVILPSAVRYLAGRPAPRSATTRSPAGGRATRRTRSSRSSASWAAASPTSRPARACRYDFVDAPGMVRLRTRAGVKSPVEVSAEILATLRQRAEDTFDDDALRRRHHRAGVFRRRPAPGDQGRRRARRPERAAPDQRADRGGDRLRPRQRAAKASTPSTTSAAAPSTSRSCA